MCSALPREKNFETICRKGYNNGLISVSATAYVTCLTMILSIMRGGGGGGGGALNRVFMLWQLLPEYLSPFIRWVYPSSQPCCSIPIAFQSIFIAGSYSNKALLNWTWCQNSNIGRRQTTQRFQEMQTCGQ